MKEGDVVLTALPQADGQLKIRPAIVLRRKPLFGDLLLCGVSSQVQNEVIGFDEQIRVYDADFPTSGLKTTSLIRLGFLATVPGSSVLGSIGKISSTRLLRLLEQLCHYLTQIETVSNQQP